MPTPRLPAAVFFLDRDSARSLQAQIRESVVEAITSKQALAGFRMPSSRQLASHLGVARMTVTLAFQELVSQGFLEARDRSAYVVADIETGPNYSEDLAPEAAVQKTDWSGFLGSSLHQRPRLRKPRNWQDYHYPFIYGQMDSRLFNLGAWRDCVRQATGHRDFGAMAGDLAESDDPMLVDFIRTKTLPRRGIRARPEEILVTVGAQNALWLAIELLTRKPLRAICENPGYPETLQSLRWCGADVMTIDTDDLGLPVDKIPPRTQAVFVTPSHQAPTGATMPPDRRLQLLQTAEDRNFVIVEDDYEFEMSFLEPPGPALKSHDRTGRVLYAGSFSKALFPGLRIGYLVGPEEVISEARQLRTLILRHPPGHLQRTVAYFLAEGHYDLLVRDIRRRLAGRRSVLQDALMSRGVQIAGASRHGGSSLWVKAPDGTDTETLAQNLLADSVLIEPGRAFFDAPDAPTELFRMGYGSIPESRIEDGVEIIARHIG